MDARKRACFPSNFLQLLIASQYPSALQAFEPIGFHSLLNRVDRNADGRITENEVKEVCTKCLTLAGMITNWKGSYTDHRI